MSNFWKWFNATRATAIETENGKRFVAAGFDLGHTGGGCTSWEKPIAGTPWVVMIATSDAGHEIEFPDEEWGVSVFHHEEGHHSQGKQSPSTDEILRLAAEMEAVVLAGNVETLEIDYL